MFIALLCYHDTGSGASPFRWYYLLSLICCAIRYRSAVAWLTFSFHCLSLLALAALLPPDPGTDPAWPWTIALMAWVTWASASLAGLLKDAGQRLEQLNAALQEHHAALERRVAERTDALRVCEKARSIQQEKMAAFGCWPPELRTRWATRWRHSARWCRCSSIAIPTRTPPPSSSWRRPSLADPADDPRAGRLLASGVDGRVAVPAGGAVDDARSDR